MRSPTNQRKGREKSASGEEWERGAAEVCSGAGGDAGEKLLQISRVERARGLGESRRRAPGAVRAARPGIGGMVVLRGVEIVRMAGREMSVRDCGVRAKAARMLLSCCGVSCCAKSRAEPRGRMAQKKRGSPSAPGCGCKGRASASQEPSSARASRAGMLPCIVGTSGCMPLALAKGRCLIQSAEKEVVGPGTDVAKKATSCGSSPKSEPGPMLSSGEIPVAFCTDWAIMCMAVEDVPEKSTAMTPACVGGMAKGSEASANKPQKTLGNGFVFGRCSGSCNSAAHPGSARSAK